MKTREDEIMSMKSRDNLLAFGDRAHFFLWWKVFFFNCSENANETSFKKLTVMENLNVTIVSKKKEIISLILILLERRKKNVSREMRQLAIEALGFLNLLFCAPKWTRFKLPSRESQSKVHDDFSKWNLRELLKSQAAAQQGHFLKWKFFVG